MKKMLFSVLFILILVAGVQAEEQYQYVTQWGGWGILPYATTFRGPYGIAVDSSRNVYVVDSHNVDNYYYIEKFDSNGKIIDRWGGIGSREGQFNWPRGIAIDSFDNIYVADTGNHRIQKFEYITGFRPLLHFVTMWGSAGSGDSQFNELNGGPYAIAVDTLGNVYAVDYDQNYNNRIQKFDSNGKFITKWGSYPSGWGIIYGIAVDSSNNVYIDDLFNHRIQKFDTNGNFITQWGSRGGSEGQFNWPQGIAVDSYDKIYVSDTGNNRIQKFNSNGKFITQWGGNGDGDGQFHYQIGITVDSKRFVYVADDGNNRIQKFTLVSNEIPTPEFPTSILPATMIIGILGTVFYIQRTKEH